MTDFKRLSSSALLVVGVLLVFFGLNAALGFMPGAAIASLAAVGALLYSGAVWLPRQRRPPPELRRARRRLRRLSSRPPSCSIGLAAW